MPAVSAVPPPVLYRMCANCGAVYNNANELIVNTLNGVCYHRYRDESIHQGPFVITHG